MLRIFLTRVALDPPAMILRVVFCSVLFGELPNNSVKSKDQWCTCNYCIVNMPNMFHDFDSPESTSNPFQTWEAMPRKILESTGYHSMSFGYLIAMAMEAADCSFLQAGTNAAATPFTCFFQIRATCIPCVCVSAWIIMNLVLDSLPDQPNQLWPWF